MPEKKLIELCREIGVERDQAKLSKLIEDLTVLLHREQDPIRANIRARLSKMVSGAF